MDQAARRLEKWLDDDGVASRGNNRSPVMGDSGAIRATEDPNQSNKTDPMQVGAEKEYVWLM